MEDQNETKQGECPYCGRPLPPDGLCRCPQARTVASLRRAAPPAPKVEKAGFLNRLTKPFFLRMGDAFECDDFEEDFEYDEEADEFAEEILEAPEPPWPRRRLASAFRNFFPFLAAYIHRPFQAMEAACRSRDLPLALLCLALFLGGGGLFAAALARQGGRFLQRFLWELASQTPFDLSPPSRIWVKPGEFFICGLLMALCWALTTALAVWAACRLARVRLSFGQALILSALCALAPALLLLLGAGALFFSFGLALDLLLLAGAMYFALLFAAASRAAGAPSGGLFCFGLLLLLFLAFLWSFRCWTYILQPALDRLLWRSVW